MEERGEVEMEERGTKLLFYEMRENILNHEKKVEESFL